MSWINITSYLSKFKDFKPSRGLLKEEAAGALSQIIGESVKPEDVEIRSGVLYLKIKNPGLRTQVFMKKKAVLDYLFTKMGKRAPNDLRF